VDQPTPAHRPMTSEEFDSSYRVLKQIVGGRCRTFTAEQRATGRAVLVHFVDQVASGGGAAVHELIEQLAPRDRAKVLETMTVGGSLVFVTEVLEGFETFEGWLRSKNAPRSDPVPPITPVPPIAPASASPGLHGEFTQLFRQSGEPPPAPRATPPFEARGGIAPQPAPEADSVSSAPPSGGGLTDLFRAPPGPLAAPPADPVAPSPRPDPLAPPPRHEPVAPPPLRVVGLRFGSAPEGLPLPPKPNFGGAFEPKPSFGGTFEPKPNFGGTSEPPPPAPVEPRLPQNLFPADAGPPPMPPVPQPIWNGPSEFTRQLERRPDLSAEAPAVVPALEPDRPPEKKSYVPLLLALNLIVIVATGLIVYFALKRC
jgi:hypothetical protein